MNIYDVTVKLKYRDNRCFESLFLNFNQFIIITGTRLYLFVPISVDNSNTNEYILHHTESTSNTQSDRHTVNLKRCTIERRNSDSHLSCSGCGICMK